MHPKITASDAAAALGKSKTWIAAALKESALAYTKANNQLHFGHETARKFFPFATAFTPRIVVFHIVKGGTGKTSLVYEAAVRASLYGAKVLCVDMDQQGNLTHAFHQDAETLPVMIDVLVDYYPLAKAIVPAAPGIDLIPSRFENAMLDEALRSKHLPLDKAYRQLLQALKSQYDLIIVDCPPSLGQSVAACALAADYLLAPVTPERFALSGLEMAYQSIQELQESFRVSVPFGIVLNKFEARTKVSQDAWEGLLKETKYQGKLLKRYIRFSQEFPKNMAHHGSIFDTSKPTIAKEDMDWLTRELLGIRQGAQGRAATVAADSRLRRKADTLETA